jgi:hypothetical protein
MAVVMKRARAGRVAMKRAVGWRLYSPIRVYATARQPKDSSET